MSFITISIQAFLYFSRPLEIYVPSKQSIVLTGVDLWVSYVYEQTILGDSFSCYLLLVLFLTYHIYFIFYSILKYTITHTSKHPRYTTFIFRYIVFQLSNTQSHRACQIFIAIL